ncbi:ATP-grasp domain-containing protein [Paenibacillus anseongense]|uniref:ATP-grasp domain-containing protein n=1 Tax=Paenibacillus anseongense TaxID=2682845 RepID=UPI002DB61D8B|nr:ATP-grasp domain-containing protein [Paenibacillus anseongense]MEC0269679.1 ATP-grasp domain-containing protein [Paenibacillus anseongense]
MKVYIKRGLDKEIANHNFYAAFDGFKQMGFEIQYFNEINDISDHNKEDIIVGYVDDVRTVFSQYRIVPPEIDYPDELKSYLGRKVWKSKLSLIANNPEKWNVFIKPVEDKKFTGVVVRGTKDLMGCGVYGEDPEIFCSDVVSFVAEWRCFVRYGKILDIRRYRGNWRVHFDNKIVENAVSQFKSAPKGYAVDFGLTDKGETLLIEVNDGYALGHYGLFSLDYAKLLSARWAELTNTVDECNF